jgi:hypothetical protein
MVGNPGRPFVLKTVTIVNQYHLTHIPFFAVPIPQAQGRKWPTTGQLDSLLCSERHWRTFETGF